MKIVIDIDESILNDAKNGHVRLGEIADAVLSGTPYKERPQGEWIPVSERLPKIDTENGWKASDVVLVCLVDGMMHMGFYCEDKKWRFCESGEAKESFWKDVIAWMPLPEPYKEAE